MSSRPFSRPKSHSQQTYASLAPRVTHISASKILKKWRPLPQPSQDRVKALLHALKAESAATRRNATVKQNSKKLDLSATEWEVVVNEVVAKLCRRLPKMPFPQTGAQGGSRGGGETDFDFEYTLDRISKLEAELSMHVESSKLLREQIKREEAMLRCDKEEYKQLEEGVSSERAVARRQEGRLHSIAREINFHDEEQQDDRRIGDRVQFENGGKGWQTRRKKSQAALANEAVENDPNLAPLVKQLRSHLGSMQNNTAGLQPVKEALEDAEVALSAFALKGLRKDQYENVFGLSI